MAEAQAATNGMCFARHAMSFEFPEGSGFHTIRPLAMKVSRKPGPWSGGSRGHAGAPHIMSFVQRQVACCSFCSRLGHSLGLMPHSFDVADRPDDVSLDGEKVDGTHPHLEHAARKARETEEEVIPKNNLPVVFFALMLVTFLVRSLPVLTETQWRTSQLTMYSPLWINQCTRRRRHLAR